MPENQRTFGDIEGYPEGFLFTNRNELSQAGVHRPRMAGICGAGMSGAESIVLSGGYEDDEDHGNEIIYTGHGGNDMETGQQIRDQELTRGNLALAHNSLNGIPVRVVRGARHKSIFSPKSGFRYDGLYRVEDFWSERGKSGYLIWRFRLVKISEGNKHSIASQEISEEKEAYAAQPAERRETTITRIVRDSEVTRQIKILHHYLCQICGIQLNTPAGTYAEAAHIKPLGRPHNGPDTPDNVLCLCPNHHVLFDRGALTINDDLTVSPTGEHLRTVAAHPINSEYVRYHREHFGQHPTQETNQMQLADASPEEVLPL